jgi:hypothetical protein
MEILTIYTLTPSLLNSPALSHSVSVSLEAFCVFKLSTAHVVSFYSLYFLYNEIEGR